MLPDPPAVKCLVLWLLGKQQLWTKLNLVSKPQLANATHNPGKLNFEGHVSKD